MANNNICTAIRGHLAEWFDEHGRVASEAPPGAADHLRNCPACARYWEGIRQTVDVLGEQDIYTSALRNRTLLALGPGVQKPAWIHLLVPATCISLAGWLAVPLVVLAGLLDLWLSDAWLSFALAASLMAAWGFLLFSLAFLAVQSAGRWRDEMIEKIAEVFDGLSS